LVRLSDEDEKTLKDMTNDICLYIRSERDHKKKLSMIMYTCINIFLGIDRISLIEIAGILDMTSKYIYNKFTNPSKSVDTSGDALSFIA